MTYSDHTRHRAQLVAEAIERLRQSLIIDGVGAEGELRPSEKGVMLTLSAAERVAGRIAVRAPDRLRERVG